MYNLISERVTSVMCSEHSKELTSEAVLIPKEVKELQQQDQPICTAKMLKKISYLMIGVFSFEGLNRENRKH